MNKVKFVGVILHIVFMLVSLPASADESPLSNLFGAIASLGKTLTTPGTGTQVQNETTSPDQIMKQLASQQMLPPCDPDFTKREIDSAINKFKMGEYSMAGAAALVQAQSVAACSLNGKGMSLPEAKDTVGLLLAISAISNHKGGLDTPETAIHGRYALTLLKLNAGKNHDLISQVEKSGVIPTGVPMSATSPYVEMTAHDAATQYTNNSFRFKKEYSGKTLRVNGEIERIGGSNNNAYIVLAGIHKASHDDEGWNDVVQCTITEPTAMNDAMNISKGQKIFVQGVYSPKSYQMGVSLDDCRIVR